MIILTKTMADAIGSLVQTAGGEATVTISLDDIVISFTRGAKRTKSTNEDRPKRKYTKRRAKLRPGENITWGDETHSPEEWAQKLGVTRKAILYRWNKWGTLDQHPTKSRPTDADKVIAGV